LRITVLGKSPAWQDADGACSGYLVEERGYRVLLDCGTGVFAKLRRYRPDRDLVDAVVITHLHADHFFDLVPFAHALRLSEQCQLSGPVPRPALYAPQGAQEVFRTIGLALGEERLIEDAFDVRDHDRRAVLELGPLRARFHEVPHFVHTDAVDVSAGDDGPRFTFSADCGPSDALVELAHDTDLLLIEATQRNPPAEGMRGHLTATEAGEHGRRAGAHRLVLTHVSDEQDADRVRSEAAVAFGGPVELAAEGAVFEV
jgi:ribonuclease BN (tRNA processing enzyme)